MGAISAALLFFLLAVCLEAQRITTKPKTIEAMESSTVELNCNIENNKNDAAVVWKRGGQPIFIDEEQVSGDARLELHRDGMNFTLQIQDLEPIDAAQYECGITDPELYITHTLIVLVRPSVAISPDANPYQVNVDENVVMKCSPSGNPIPEVRWTLRGGALPPAVEQRDNQLRIAHAKVGHAGTYECMANSSVGMTTATITLVVNEPDTSKNKTAPWVRTNLAYIPTSVGGAVNVTCQYDGEPSPQVEWLFNGYRLNVAEEKFRKTVQFGQRQANYTETTLQINELTEDSFGDYTCRVSNNVGTAQETIHVSGRPGPPVLSLHGGELTWTVQSNDQLSECRVHYRLAQEDNFQEHHLVKIHKNEREGELWEHTTEMGPLLAKGHTYEIQVDCRNALGWGSLARDYITLTIPDDSPAAMSSSTSTFISIGVLFAVVFGIFRL